MKKARNFIITYLLFGIIIAGIIAIDGGYTNLMINHTMGNMSAGTFAGLMIYTALMWLPAALTTLLSPSGYINIPMGKTMIVLVLIMFIITNILVNSKKS